MKGNISLESLIKTMQGAEQRWQTEESQESGEPLGYEELTRLRRGDKVTVVKWYISLVDVASKRYETSHEVCRATITRVRQHGWTDLKGFWSCREHPTDRTREDVRLLVGHEVGKMVPAYLICYKRTDGYSERYDLTSLDMTQVYRGWSVQP